MSDNKIIPQQSEGQGLKDTNSAKGKNDPAKDKSNGIDESKISENIPLVEKDSEQPREEAIEDHDDKKKPPQFKYFSQMNRNMKETVEQFAKMQEDQCLVYSRLHEYETFIKPPPQKFIQAFEPNKNRRCVATVGLRQYSKEYLEKRSAKLEKSNKHH